VDQLSQRRSRLADTLVGEIGIRATPANLARAATVVLELETATISLTSPGGTYLAGAHGPLGEDIEEIQRQLDDGPTLSAFTDHGPIIVLDAPAGLLRWSAFGHKAMARGITALFALPLRPRRDPPAVLSLYTISTHDFDAARVGDVLLAADLIAEALVNPSSDGLRERLGQVGDDRSAVHHAIGIVAERRGLSPAEALSSLRSQAVGAMTSVADVALQVLARQRPDDPI
jgi:hypothetical protein